MFQSHSGSIRSIRLLIQPRHPHSFQSHSGSIRSSGEAEGSSPEIRFNPTLVRLEGENGFLHVDKRLRFNPTLVRLEGPRVLLRPRRSTRGFNPTLVRLEGRRVCHLQRTQQCFNPTLVRLEVAEQGSAQEISHAVSIPLWFD